MTRHQRQRGVGPSLGVGNEWLRERHSVFPVPHSPMTAAGPRPLPALNSRNQLLGWVRPSQSGWHLRAEPDNFQSCKGGCIARIRSPDWGAKAHK